MGEAEVLASLLEELSLPLALCSCRGGRKLQQRVPDVSGGDPLSLTHPKGEAHTCGRSY